MSLQERMPQLNYAAVTGVVKKRSGLFSTLKGVSVIHLLVENTLENSNRESGTDTWEIRVDIWGNAARALDERLVVGDGILAEGILAHREVKDYDGGVRHQNVLRARRIEILYTEKERKA
jgi:single-stranded DNA-binding protein